MRKQLTPGVTAVLIVFGVLILRSPMAAAQLFAQRDPEIRLLPPVVPQLEVPPLVRFTGTLLPPDEKANGGVHTLRIFIQNKEWLFRLENVETLSGTNYGWMILGDLFPPELHFTGPADLLGPLQQPELAGKMITVEGRLYLADRMLAVTAAGEDIARPK